MARPKLGLLSTGYALIGLRVDVIMWEEGETAADISSAFLLHLLNFCCMWRQIVNLVRGIDIMFMLVYLMKAMK